MERKMAVSLRESVQLVSDPRNLDASVDEVFQMMLELPAGGTARRLSMNLSRLSPRWLGLAAC